MANLPTIALFGAGFHGLHAVLPAILRLKDKIQLSAIVEPSEVNREKAAGIAPGIPLFTSAEALFEAQRPTIAYVATLPHLHEPLALLALQFGCHVVCEKPLAPTVEACKRMVEAAKASGRLLVTMFENRYKGHNRQVRQWILEGQIGRVEALHLQKFWSGPVTEPRRTDLLNASGSLDCGIHTLDLARYYVQGGEWEVIHALGQWFDEPHLDNPPHTAILARLQNGPLVTMNDSMSYRIAFGKRTGARSGPESTMIIGTQGIIESVGDAYHLHKSDGTEAFVNIDKSTHAEEIPWVLSDVLSAIETGTPESGFLPTGYDGLMAQHIVEAANQQANQTRVA